MDECKSNLPNNNKDNNDNLWLPVDHELLLFHCLKFLEPLYTTVKYFTGLQLLLVKTE